MSSKRMLKWQLKLMADSGISGMTSSRAYQPLQPHQLLNREVLSHIYPKITTTPTKRALEPAIDGSKGARSPELSRRILPYQGRSATRTPKTNSRMR
jgi:hypothetical protein